MYIQPSEKLKEDVSAVAEQYKRGAKIFTTIPKVRWAPYVASGKQLAMFICVGFGYLIHRWLAFYTCIN